MKRELHTWTYRVLACLVAILMVAGTGGCQKGDKGAAGLTGQPGTPGEPGLPGEPAPIDTTLAMFEDLPGIVLTVTDVTGGTGLAGQFQPGDTISVRFTLETGDGRALGVKDLDVTNIWFTGPTDNYQRVIPSDGGFFLTDVKDTASINVDGSYTYNFTLPIPATYGPPLNDSPNTTVDELTGQALLSGTYTISMVFGKEYYVGSDLNLDVANHAEDVLVGTETTITPREVVGADNCAACHVQIRHHELEEGNNETMMFRDPRICVTCHTSGAEDDDQKASIDFRVMIHKIHNGSHLPSVNGVTTNSDGTRNYAGTIAPYQVGDKDYSYVNFPVWPNFNIGMPRDVGYSALSTSTPSITNAGGVALKGAQAIEGQLLKGVTSCAKCHGDGGDGSITPPAQGDLAFYQQSRRSCGSCHDDIRWDDPGKPGAANYKYVSNYSPNGMPAQTSDSSCVSCHSATFDAAALPNSSLAVPNAHLHPLLNKRPAVTGNYFNPGININLTDVAEAGLNNTDGTIDPGEKIAITFTATDDAGSNVAISNTNVFMNWRSAITVTLAGPTSNLNIVDYGALPVPALVGLSSPYTVNVPEPIVYDLLGTGTGGSAAYTPMRTPVWNIAAGASPTAVALIGTAQSGTASTIKFCQTTSSPVTPTAACPAAASKTDETYTGNWVWITGGTGSGQSRLIVSYAGASYTATVLPNWATNPDSTSTYAVGAAVIPWIYTRTATLTPASTLMASVNARDSYIDIDTSGDPRVHVATAQAGCSGSCKTITLAASASGSNDYYKDYWIAITSGTGKAQTQKITGYVGGTKVATVASNWSTNPDATSVYRIQPFYGSASSGGTSGAGDDIVIDDGVQTAGTLQAGCTAPCKTVTLDASASSVNNDYTGGRIEFSDGQVGSVISYNGTTKVAILAANLSVTVSNATTYVLGKEEYIRINGFIAPVPGDTNQFHQRLLMGSSYTTSQTNATKYLRYSHSSGASVTKVTLNGPKKLGATGDYTVDPSTSVVTGTFTAGQKVLISYTTDFVMPYIYPPPFFDSPNLSSDDIETWGAWKNKSVVSGTYLVGVWSAMTEALLLNNEVTSFTEATPPQDFMVKVGSAASLTNYDKIESSISEDSKLVAGQTCNACHNTIRFHGGGRRDFETCIMCHGTAGMQAGVTNVPSENVNFRLFLHEFHRPDFWPQPTFVSDTGEEGEPEVFPAMPGGAATCTKCHGEATAWQVPVSRDHPTEQGAPTRVYRASCEGCHESSAAEAHIDIQTSEEGVESCSVCHGDGAEFDVKLVHKRQ